MGIDDSSFMKKALALAEKARDKNEVPVGALVVQFLDHESGKPLAKPRIVGQAYNLRENHQNPIAHAEVLALQKAAKKLGRWRLIGCTLYVTLEPCLMCAGAIVLSRVDRVVYGAVDPKAGAVESLYKVLSDEKLNHRPEVMAGLGADAASALLKDFFSKKRSSKKIR